MSRRIPKIIDSEEILVRFIFDTHFKKKVIDVSKIDSAEVFLDLRGVSLQRAEYCNENKCKTQAKSIPSKKYIGFVIFRKNKFETERKEHQKLRPDFEAEIIHSPLDEYNNYRSDDDEVNTDTLGNPSHADLNYLNPAITEADNGSPKVAVRLFSRKLMLQSKVIIDEDRINELYTMGQFSTLI